MVKMVCEMCNASDFKKENGFFVCQYCGVKYSPEEAKHMIIDGTVAVQGTVQVDHSSELENDLLNARRAMKKEDWEKAEHYYDLVEKHDPSNWEAIFYSSYSKAKVSLLSNDIYNRQASFKILRNSLALMVDKFHIEQEAAYKTLIGRIHSDIIAMAQSAYVYTQTITNREVTSDNSLKTVKLFHELSRDFMVALINIAERYPGDRNHERIFYYELALIHGENILLHNCQIDSGSIRSMVQSCRTQIEKISDPEAYAIKQLHQKKKAPFSIIALISGLLNMVCMWIPYLQKAVLFIAIAGFVCGIIGAGSSRKGSSKAGIALNVVSFNISIILTAIYTGINVYQ